MPSGARMMMSRCCWLFAIAAVVCGLKMGRAVAGASVGSRLAYLVETDPYHPDTDFPKLTTPMWVGEDDVESSSKVTSHVLKDREAGS